PVVRNISAVVVTHYVRRRGVRTGGVVGVQTTLLSLARLRYEALHRAGVDVCNCIAGAVRTATILIVAIVEGLDAHTGSRIGHADRKLAPLLGYAVRPRIGAEIRVKGAVLLHDD